MIKSVMEEEQLRLERRKAKAVAAAALTDLGWLFAMGRAGANEGQLPLLSLLLREGGGRTIGWLVGLSIDFHCREIREKSSGNAKGGRWKWDVIRERSNTMCQIRQRGTEEDTRWLRTPKNHNDGNNE